MCACVSAMLKPLGISVDPDIKILLVAGDSDLILDLISELQAVHAPSSSSSSTSHSSISTTHSASTTHSKRSVHSTVSKQSSDSRLSVKSRSSSASKPSLLPTLPHAHTHTHTAHSRTNSSSSKLDKTPKKLLMELLMSVTSRSLSLSQSDTSELLLTNPYSHTPLSCSHIFTHGSTHALSNVSSYTHVYEWLDALQQVVHSLALYAQQSNSVCYLFTLFSSGLLSANLRICESLVRLMAEIVSILNNAPSAHSGAEKPMDELWLFFTSPQVYTSTTASPQHLSCLDALVRMCNTHPSFISATHPPSTSPLTSIILPICTSHYFELFSIYLPAACNESDPAELLRLMHCMIIHMSISTTVPTTTVLSDGVCELILDTAFQRAADTSIAAAARCVAMQLLSEMYIRYCELASAKMHVHTLVDLLRRNSRLDETFHNSTVTVSNGNAQIDANSDIRQTAITCMFRLLDTYAENARMSESVSLLFKTLIFALIESHTPSPSTSSVSTSIRSLLVDHMCATIRAHPSLPIYILISPLIQQYTLNATLIDMPLLQLLAEHQLPVQFALLFMHFLGKLAMNESTTVTDRASELFGGMIMRYCETAQNFDTANETAVLDYTEKYAKVALSLFMSSTTDLASSKQPTSASQRTDITFTPASLPPAVLQRVSLAAVYRLCELKLPQLHVRLCPLLECVVEDMYAASHPLPEMLKSMCARLHVDIARVRAAKQQPVAAAAVVVEKVNSGKSRVVDEIDPRASVEDVMAAVKRAKRATAAAATANTAKVAAVSERDAVKQKVRVSERVKEPVVASVETEEEVEDGEDVVVTAITRTNTSTTTSETAAVQVVDAQLRSRADASINKVKASREARLRAQTQREEEERARRERLAESSARAAKLRRRRVMEEQAKLARIADTAQKELESAKLRKMTHARSHKSLPASAPASAPSSDTPPISTTSTSTSASTSTSTTKSSTSSSIPPAVTVTEVRHKSTSRRSSAKSHKSRRKWSDFHNSIDTACPPAVSQFVSRAYKLPLSRLHKLYTISTSSADSKSSGHVVGIAEWMKFCGDFAVLPQRLNKQTCFSIYTNLARKCESAEEATRGLAYTEFVNAVWCVAKYATVSSGNETTKTAETDVDDESQDLDVTKMRALLGYLKQHTDVEKIGVVAKNLWNTESSSKMVDAPVNKKPLYVAPEPTVVEVVDAVVSEKEKAEKEAMKRMRAEKMKKQVEEYKQAKMAKEMAEADEKRRK